MWGCRWTAWDQQTIPYIVRLRLPLETLVHTDHLNGAAHTGDCAADKLSQKNHEAGFNTRCFFAKSGLLPRHTHLITEGSLVHQDNDKKIVTAIITRKP